jgi:CRP/FNR family transcriptional regulator, polysaccharide utilization system transcription regulator
MVMQYVSEPDFELLYNSTQQLRYKKGEHILKQGALFSHVAFLSKGIVKISYENEFGKSIILSVNKGPAFLGGANFFLGVHHFNTITAIDPCDVCLIDVNVLKNMILKNGMLNFKLIEFISAMFKSSILNFINLSQKHVNGKVADILIYLSKNIYESEEFTLGLTRKEMADYAGCSQENMINTLSKFNKDKIIRNEGKKITIINMKKLAEISRFG